ncbi:MAG: PD40 domain-containing protein [Kiritimatiellae bacterium]|nr:PD40 domain-containing protein [Kiritimatiellia bacterium]
MKWLAALAVALCAASSPGQAIIRGKAGAQTPVCADSLRGAGGLAPLGVQVIKTDLGRTGWTTLADAGTASVQLGGGVSADASGGVTFQLRATDAAGNAVFQRTYQCQGTAGAVVGTAHKAADEFTQAVTGKKTFLQAKIACLKSAGGTRTVQIGDSAMRFTQPIRAGGGPARQEICVRPRWSWDGGKITFTSFLRRFPDVYMYELATGRITPLAQWPGMNTGGALSPDSRSLAVILSKDGNPDLYVMDMATRQLKRLTNTRGVSEGSPCWSPDGQRIAYVSDATRTPQIYVIPRNGGQPQQLTRGAHSASPDWGPGGLIAYQVQQGRQFQIAVMDPNTRQERVVTAFDASYEDPSWAPDGRHLAATRTVNYRTDIVLLDTERDAMGRIPPAVQLTQDGTWSSPAWTH